MAIFENIPCRQETNSPMRHHYCRFNARWGGCEDWEAVKPSYTNGLGEFKALNVQMTFNAFLFDWTYLLDFLISIETIAIMNKEVNSLNRRNYKNYPIVICSLTKTIIEICIITIHLFIKLWSGYNCKFYIVNRT